MKVKNCNAAVSSLAGMRCDFPTTNFMALGQCNCSNYFTLERQARAGCSQSPDSRSHFPLALSPTRKRIFLPSWLTFGGNVCGRELARIRKREMQLNCYCRGIIMHKCLLLSPLSGFLCSVTNLRA